MKKKAFRLIPALIAAVMLIGCGSEEEAAPPTVVPEPIVIDDSAEPDPVQEPEAESSTAAAEPEEEPEEVREGYYRSELTGEWTVEELKDQRPIAVMVDNEITALPH